MNNTKTHLIIGICAFLIGTFGCIGNTYAQDITPPSLVDLVLEDTIWKADGTKEYTLTIIAKDDKSGFADIGNGISFMIDNENGTDLKGYFTWYPEKYRFNHSQTKCSDDEGGLLSQDSDFANNINITGCKTFIENGAGTIDFVALTMYFTVNTDIGNHIDYFNVWTSLSDAAGNVDGPHMQEKFITTDGIPPTIIMSTDPISLNGNKFGSIPAILLDIQDIHSGAYKYKLEWNSPSIPNIVSMIDYINNETTITLSNPGIGTHVLYIHAIDHAENLLTINKTFTIDDAATIVDFTSDDTLRTVVDGDSANATNGSTNDIVISAIIEDQNYTSVRAAITLYEISSITDTSPGDPIYSAQTPSLSPIGIDIITKQAEVLFTVDAELFSNNYSKSNCDMTNCPIYWTMRTITPNGISSEKQNSIEITDTGTTIKKYGAFYYTGEDPEIQFENDTPLAIDKRIINTNNNQDIRVTEENGKIKTLYFTLTNPESDHSVKVVTQPNTTGIIEYDQTQTTSDGIDEWVYIAESNFSYEDDDIIFGVKGNATKDIHIFGKDEMGRSNKNGIISGEETQRLIYDIEGPDLVNGFYPIIKNSLQQTLSSNTWTNEYSALKLHWDIPSDNPDTHNAGIHLTDTFDYVIYPQGTTNSASKTCSPANNSTDLSFDTAINTNTLSGLSDGVFWIDFYAADQLCQITHETEVLGLKIDTTRPTISNLAITGTPTYLQVGTYTFTAQVDDQVALSGVDTGFYDLKIRKGQKIYTLEVYNKSWTNNIFEGSFDIKDFAGTNSAHKYDGSNVDIVFNVRDNAGNESNANNINNFITTTIDTQAPIITIRKPEDQKEYGLLHDLDLHIHDLINITAASYQVVSTTPGAPYDSTAISIGIPVTGYSIIDIQSTVGTAIDTLFGTHPTISKMYFTLYVSSTDEAGNIGTQTSDFSIDPTSLTARAYYKKQSSGICSSNSTEWNNDEYFMPASKQGDHCFLIEFSKSLSTPPTIELLNINTSSITPLTITTPISSSQGTHMVTIQHSFTDDDDGIYKLIVASAIDNTGSAITSINGDTQTTNMIFKIDNTAPELTELYFNTFTVDGVNYQGPNTLRKFMGDVTEPLSSITTSGIKDVNFTLLQKINGNYIAILEAEDLSTTLKTSNATWNYPEYDWPIDQMGTNERTFGNGNPQDSIEFIHQNDYRVTIIATDYSLNSNTATFDFQWDNVAPLISQTIVTGSIVQDQSSYALVPSAYATATDIVSGPRVLDSSVEQCAANSTTLKLTSTEMAYVYYTLDGTTPNESVTYTEILKFKLTTPTEYSGTNYYKTTLTPSNNNFYVCLSSGQTFQYIAQDAVYNFFYIPAPAPPEIIHAGPYPALKNNVTMPTDKIIWPDAGSYALQWKYNPDISYSVSGINYIDPIIDYLIYDVTNADDTVLIDKINMYSNTAYSGSGDIINPIISSTVITNAGYTIELKHQDPTNLLELTITPTTAVVPGEERIFMVHSLSNNNLYSAAQRMTLTNYPADILKKISTKQVTTKSIVEQGTPVSINNIRPLEADATGKLFETIVKLDNYPLIAKSILQIDAYEQTGTGSTVYKQHPRTLQLGSIYKADGTDVLNYSTTPTTILKENIYHDILKPFISPDTSIYILSDTDPNNTGNYSQTLEIGYEALFIDLNNDGAFSHKDFLLFQPYKSGTETFETRYSSPTYPRVELFDDITDSNYSLGIYSTF